MTHSKKKQAVTFPGKSDVASVRKKDMVFKNHRTWQYGVYIEDGREIHPWGHLSKTISGLPHTTLHR
jgi:hypothetical protein